MEKLKIFLKDYVVDLSVVDDDDDKQQQRVDDKWTNLWRKKILIDDD